MILYKYVTRKRAEKFFKKPTVRFTPPPALNDPYELSSSYYESLDNHYADDHHSLRRLMLSDGYGILSLSRSPNNALMWSHYGTGTIRSKPKGISLRAEKDNAHGGFVIGIDIDQSGLNDSRINIVPAKFGSVIYTKTKPIHDFASSEDNIILDSRQCSFSPQHLEAIQRYFLYKSIDWSYEQEVRVVRNIHRLRLNNQISNEFLELDRSTIKEFYIGAAQCYDKKDENYYKRKILKSFPGCNVFQCTHDIRSWDVLTKKI